MPFYLLPIEQVGNQRGPRHLNWRGAKGLSGKWSLKDFGPAAPVGLVAAQAHIVAPDVLALTDWTAKTRENVRGYLRQVGIDGRWVAKARDWREGIHRLAGVSQAMQANTDNAGDWLAKDVLFGFVGLPALRYRPPRTLPDAPPLSVRWPRRANWWARTKLILRHLPLAFLMALPATDAFTTVSNAALTTYSASWSLNSGNFQVDASDVVVSNANAECGAFWNADAFNGNHYAFITRTAVGTDWLGPGTRHAGAGTASYYGFYTNGTGSETFLFKMVTGTWTQLGSAGSTNIVANDVLRLESNGTTHTPLRNGSTYTSIGAQTDSSLSNGAAGMCGYGLATLSNAGDSWEGGNLGAAAASFLPRRHGMAHMIVR